MCGIIGMYEQKKGIDPQLVESMNTAITHRGPDDSGVYMGKQIALGMRRLSIIDLAGGHQPIYNEDKSIVIVFNGEIYNYQELRVTLLQKGHLLQTKSDTEVIIHLYEEYKEKCVQYLNGMFAFIIYDQKEQVIFAARDRMGEKPLHYCWLNNQTLLMASEIKSILQYPNQYTLNYSAIDRYFSFGYIPAPQTSFTEIQKLPAGYYLRFSMKEQALQIVQYWDVPYDAAMQEQSKENLSKEFIELLEDSVRKKLIADVPIGVFLSGGLDSSTIVALASRLSSAPVQTFSIAYTDQSFDESQYARLVAKQFHTNHHELLVQPEDLIQVIAQVFGKYIDEPLSDPASVPNFILSQFTAQQVKVALKGDGGDELFAGYDTHIAHKLHRFYNYIPQVIREKLIRDMIVNHLPISLGNYPFDFKARRFVQGAELPQEERHFFWQASFFPQEKKKIYTEQFLHNLHNQNPYDIVSHYLTGKTVPNNIEYLDLKMYLADDILHVGDLVSMANSLEIRNPFLDHRLVELSARIPFNLKLHGFTSKYLYKKSVEQLLPKKIIYRKKQGFGLPLGQWLKEDLFSFMTDLLNKTSIEKAGLFQYSQVEKLMKEHREGLKNNRKQLWSLMVFQLWFNKFITNRKSHL